MKILPDLKFIKSCKTENIFPTFAKVKLSLRYSKYGTVSYGSRNAKQTLWKEKTKERDETYWNPNQTLTWFDII